MRLKFFSILMFFSLFLASFKVVLGLVGEIEMKNYDEALASLINTPSGEVINYSNNQSILENNAFISRVDETGHTKIDQLMQEAISQIATTTLSKDVFICHSDEAMHFGLRSAKINDNVVASQKVPILFVPGLLGTRAYQYNKEIWPNALRIVFDGDDNFLDVLELDSYFNSSNLNLEFREVIKTEPLLDYSQGLINEFKNRGYAADDGQEGQNFFTFPYDWRYGVTGKNPDGKTNSDLLKEKIDQLAQNSPNGKVHVIAHSLGGLVAKKYIVDNPDSKIGKMIFVGVPNLGSPDAIQTLLSGNDFKIPGLNPEEMRKISYNMPAAYDLLAGKNYYDHVGSYLGLLTQSTDMSRMDYRTLNHEDSQLYLRSRLNKNGLVASGALRTAEFDFYDVRPRVTAAYNIVGCKSKTLLYASGNTPGLPPSSQPRPIISGDDTVPFESGDSIPIDNDKAFYLPLAEHGKMPSNESIRKMILAIIEGTSVPQKIISRATLQSNISLCQLDGVAYEAKSPLDITVTDPTGKILLGVDSDGNIRYEIPGASYENIDGHKYVYLPSEYDGLYDVNLKGTGTGTFTFIKKEINNGQIDTAKIFNDIPVTPDFSAKLEVSGDSVSIVKNDQTVIEPTSLADPRSAGDIIAPQTTATVNAQAPKPYYNSEINIDLDAYDFAQEGSGASGTFSITYKLDDSATTTVKNASTTVKVSGDGPHRLVFYATDKLGNRETPQMIEFAIDKIAPEIKIQFSPNRKDLVFSATDNFSASGKITVIGEEGAVAAVDEAGNTTKLSFKEKDRRRSMRAELESLAYNGQTIDMAGRQLSFAWFFGPPPKLPGLANGLLPLPAFAQNQRNGPLSFLLQQARLKDGSFVVALYSGGKTTIIEYRGKKLVRKIFLEMRLIEFTTKKGEIAWSY